MDIGSPSAGTPAEARRALRQHLIDLRRNLPESTVETWSLRVRDHLADNYPDLAGKRVAFCWPIQNEPDLRPLMQGWQAEGNPGFAALLPVVVDAGRALTFRAWTPDCTMHADRYGIPTPSSGEFLTPEALLIPVNVFDTRGYRIGYGGGYFDRTLASLRPRPIAIGVGFELARVDSIDPEEHDEPLAAIVTEAGVLRV